MSKEKHLPKQVLIDLYLKQKLSAATIAKQLSCRSHVTILNYLKKYNVSRRSRLGNRVAIHITKENLFDLYHTQKLTQKQIAKNFGNQSDTGIRRLMKIYGIETKSNSEFHTKYPKFDFSGNPKEKAYLIGFRLGDLNIYQIHELIQVRCSSTIKEQADLFKHLFNDYGYVNISIAKRGTFEMVILLNNSFSFLIPKLDRIEKWILKKHEYFLSFLAGYVDAEGSYYIRKPRYKNSKIGWGVFEVQTYDKNIICTISQKLNSWHIDNTISVSKKKILQNKDMWRLTIVKKQFLWNFLKLIKPYQKHKNKIMELEAIENNLILRNSLPYCRSIRL